MHTTIHQVAVATLFDHVGCLGLPVRKLDCKKCCGLLVLIVGVSMGVMEDLRNQTAFHGGPAFASMVLVSLAAMSAGALLPVQASVNRALSESLGGTKLR